jgi:pimeloyl-ACP methyl ester carboxylesterase
MRSENPGAVVSGVLPRLEPLRSVRTDALEVAYFEAGPGDGEVALLLHGFPYDIHSYVDVIPRLVEAGHRVIAPYLRGHGPTRFLDSAIPRSGQLAAIGADVIALLDALGIARATFAGYDWGGRAACVAAALAFDNPDYVEVVLHSYRHRLGYAPSYPPYDQIEQKLATQPAITVPAVTLDGLADGNFPATDGCASARHFTGPSVHHQVPNAGHNLPQEAPEAFASAVLELAHLRSPSAGV